MHASYKTFIIVVSLLCVSAVGCKINKDRVDTSLSEIDRIETTYPLTTPMCIDFDKSIKDAFTYDVLTSVDPGKYPKKNDTSNYNDDYDGDGFSVSAGEVRGGGGYGVDGPVVGNNQLARIGSSGDGASGEQRPNFTRTNTQELSVDEPDIVKSIGNYVFSLNNQSLKVYQTWPFSQFKLVKNIVSKELGRTVKQAFPTFENDSTAIEGMLAEDFPSNIRIGPVADRSTEEISLINMSIVGNQLIVFAAVSSLLVPIDYGRYNPDANEETNDPKLLKYRELLNSVTGRNTETRIYIFDISNPAEMTLKRIYDYNTKYQSSRTNDKGIFFFHTLALGNILSAYEYQGGYLRKKALDVYYSERSICKKGNEKRCSENDHHCVSENAEIGKKCDEHAEKRLRTFVYNHLDIMSLLDKHYRVVSYDAHFKLLKTSPLFSCDSVQYVDKSSSDNIYNVSRVPIQENGSLDTSMIAAKYKLDYVTDKSIYLSYSTPWTIDTAKGRVTRIYKFSFNDNGPAVSFHGEGYVNGFVRSKFYLSEKGDSLRVLSSYKMDRIDPRGYNQHRVEDTQHSLSILQNSKKDPKSLTVVSSVDQFGVDTQMTTARFIGDNVYVLTAKEIDPLYVINVADPLKPKLLGKLDISGFSTYVHPLDENHILTIGYANTARDSSQRMLQLFDVSDPLNPVLKANYKFIGVTTALHDFYAFDYDPLNHILSIPVQYDADSYRRSGIGAKIPEKFVGFYYFHIGDTSITLMGEINQLDYVCKKKEGKVASSDCMKRVDPSDAGLRSVIVSDKNGDVKGKEIDFYTFSFYGAFGQSLSNMSDVKMISNDVY